MCIIWEIKDIIASLSLLINYLRTRRVQIKFSWLFTANWSQICAVNFHLLHYFNIVTRWKHMFSFVLLLQDVSDVTLDRSLVRPWGRFWTWLKKMFTAPAGSNFGCPTCTCLKCVGFVFRLVAIYRFVCQVCYTYFGGTFESPYSICSVTSSLQ